jgi:hypothetical protein
MKRARITAPLGFLDRDSSMSDEPSLSPESFDFSSCRLAIGSRPFLTGIPCGDATRAGSTTPKSGTENAAPAERCVEGCLLRRWRPPPASAHIAIQKNNGQADQRQLCSVNAHGTENGVSRHFNAEQWHGLAMPTPAEARRRAQPAWAKSSGIGRERGSAAVDQLIIIIIRIGFEFGHFVV